MAIDVPSIVAVQLRVVAWMLKLNLQDITPVRLENEHHITLRYIGDSTTGQLRDILGRHSLSAAPPPEFQLHLDGVNAFPDLDSPEVVWAGIGGDIETLKWVQARVDADATSCGAPPMDFPFTPHITVAHIGRAALSEQDAETVRTVLRAIRSDPPFQPPDHAWTVQEITAIARPSDESRERYTRLWTLKTGPETLPRRRPTGKPQQSRHHQ